MQNLVVIRSIEWIESLFTEQIKKSLFGGDLIHEHRESSSPKLILQISSELARVSVAINANPTAIEVLKAFRLEMLANYDFSSIFAESQLTSKEGQSRALIYQVMGSWNIMIRSSAIWKALTIPSVLTSENNKGEILSIELQYEGVNPSATVLSKAIEAIESLYEAIAAAYQIEESEALRIIKTDSGSNVRVDLKGVGTIIKQLKETFLEIWHKVRHKRVEEVIENNKAILSSLAVVQQIDNLQNAGTLTHEEASRIKHNVLSSATALINNRTLIVDIPYTEEVNNVQMLEGFSPKLLSQGSGEYSEREDTGSLEADALTAQNEKSNATRKTVQRKAPKKQSKAPVKRKPRSGGNTKE